MESQKGPRQGGPNTNNLLEKLLKVKKSYVVISLLALFLIAGFVSALSTITGIKPAPKSTSTPDSSYSVVNSTDDQATDQPVTGSQTQNTPSNKNSPGQSSGKTPDKTSLNGVQIILNVTSSNSGSTNKSTVVYSVDVQWQSQDAEKIFKSSTVSFFTDAANAGRFPTRKIGDAILSASGDASIQFEQDPGNYIGGAVLTGFGGTKTESSILQYTINKPDTQKPTLSFKVEVKKPVFAYNPGNNIPTIPFDFKNVVYMLIVSVPDALKGKLAGAQNTKVDFYTGPQGASFPSQYVGSALLLSNQASFTFHQEPGTYIGAAIWNDTPWGRVNSPVNKYTISKFNIPTPGNTTPTQTPKPTDTIKPTHTPTPTKKP